MEVVIQILIGGAFLVFCYWMIRERTYVKQNYYCYDSSNLNRPGVPSIVLSVASKEEAPLSANEAKAYEILSKVPGTSIIGFTIREAIGNAVAKRDRGIIRKLIGELRQQCEDAPYEMISVVGVEGYVAIMKCKKVL